MTANSLLSAPEKNNITAFKLHVGPVFGSTMATSQNGAVFPRIDAPTIRVYKILRSPVRGLIVARLFKSEKIYIRI
ncbi:hypothetical protein HYALB_00004571 [Hymenoscyphus albidus]|uniref:Uncharacterized protein n=1 Tax=Hymenoscyphus albidus TaxID=595503 RepID=A0A9N9Q269_9HELO|nr:hypothetical protein HYALB_00004571 [Hymenoscyphus albidus]